VRAQSSFRNFGVCEICNATFIRMESTGMSNSEFRRHSFVHEFVLRTRISIIIILSFKAQKMRVNLPTVRILYYYLEFPSLKVRYYVRLGILDHLTTSYSFVHESVLRTR
jgi:hypothetical protein